MSNRLLPYGYRVHDGRLMIDGAEAIVVKEVCKMRASGMILSEIADKLNLRGIPFYETAGWDKHKVKRLLENDRYIGKDGYPPILSEDELLTARNYKYRAETEHVCPPTIQKLKNIMVCEECGAKLYRIFSKKSKKTPIVWQCWECVIPFTRLILSINNKHTAVKFIFRQNEVICQNLHLTVYTSDDIF